MNTKSASVFDSAMVCRVHQVHVQEYKCNYVIYYFLNQIRKPTLFIYTLIYEYVFYLFQTSGDFGNRRKLLFLFFFLNRFYNP